MKKKNMRNISKEIFLNTLVCHTLVWLLRMRKEEISREPTLGEKFRMEEGNEIHRRARELYPDGFLIDDKEISSASKRTKDLMKNPKISTIFEGVFFIDKFVARADILKQESKGYHLIEVKSSINDKKEFIDDMAYTTLVIERCGFDISKISILLLSKDFQLGMKSEDLFVEIDHTKEVLDQVEEFKTFWEPVEKITRQLVKPDPELQFSCRKCELFKECLGKDINNHIFEIPRLSQGKFDQLKELSIVCIEDIPDGFPLTKRQAIVRNCVRAKKPFVGGTLKNELKSISWPAYYLDFETVMTAVPLYPDVVPYTQIPTQYSIHKCSEPGCVINQFEYIANQRKDCRRELAENLIHHLEGKGSIITYGNFEKNIITQLSTLYPNLSSEFNSLVDRMVDLEAIIKKNYYHPDFRGSTSIKNTLPVLVPDLSYDDLEFRDGDSAMAAFAYLAFGKWKRENETIKNLLEYCEQDSLAMVKLHQQLVKYTCIK